MHGRVDQAVYANGTKAMVGWIPAIQGPAIAAPGTHFVEVARGPCRLIAFEPYVDQGYVIEASNLKFRFYTNDDWIVTAPDTPYEVTHPYSYADLLDLDYQESIDVVYFAGGAKAPSVLSRTGAETFAFALLDMRNGPIGQPNADETITVTASATTGSVTLTANGDIFEAGHVGGFFELEAKDFNDVKSWEPGMRGITVGTTKLTWAGRTYLATAAANGTTPRTGSVPPIHDTGSEWDGQGALDINGKGEFGIKWQYLYNRIGLLKITAFTSATQVTATVVKRLADSLTGTASWRWAHGAFSDAAGWPETVCIWDQCVVMTRDGIGYTSVIDGFGADFVDFERRDSAGDFQRDLAGTFSTPDPARIQWSAADKLLVLGTEKGEVTVERLQIQTGSAGPPVFAVRRQTQNGSRRMKPLAADGRLLFAQRAGRKLREMGYQLAADRYSAPDMTRLADHIGAPGFVELAWQAEPERLAWAVRGDGTLAGMTYDPDQQVMGWFRRALGGGLLAKSICRITDPEGKRDQLWIAVAKSAAEDAPWWVLRMHKIWETADDQADVVMLDAALTYDGAPATVISGFDHWEDDEIALLADGKPHPPRTVSGGEVTLAYAARKVHGGKDYDAYIDTLEPEAGQGEGTAQTKLKRILAVNLRVAEAQGLRVQVQGCDLIPVETRTNEDAMDVAIPLFTGDIQIPTIGTYERLGSIRVERFQPTPATLIAIVPALEVGET
jgi:hypothetical protein